MQPPPKKLLNKVRDAIHFKHYAYRTEETYVQWIRRYILFHNKHHPKEMGKAEIEAFLIHLAVEGQVSASTQNQALSALLFLYREVLNLDMAGIDAVRTPRPQYVPTVLTKHEAIAAIQQCDGIYQLVVKLLYGSGLRSIEGLRLPVKDVDFAQQQIVVRDGKGSKSRVTILPSSVAAELPDHLVGAQRQHQRDLSRGFGAVNLPFALERKYPNANRQWIWQYVFPSGSITKDPRNGLMCRHHLQLGGAIDCLSLTIAAWCQYLNGYDDQNRPIPIDDPLADILTQRASLSELDPRPLLSIFEIFGDLVQSPRFVETVADKLRSLHEFGAQGTLARFS
jgi:integron integrase